MSRTAISILAAAVLAWLAGIAWFLAKVQASDGINDVG